MNPPPPAIGVLLLQLGTPAAPTAQALRPYLRQFLSDPRVIEIPRLLWWPILNLAILPFRPAQSAAKYARIWSSEKGSPLLHYTLRQRNLLAQTLGPGYRVEAGMSYGEPSVATSMQSLLERGVDRIVALPMYPQYAASSTGSALDALYHTALARRAVPAIRVVPPFFVDEDYLSAIETRYRERLATLPTPPDHTLISFHGLPVRMIEKGDPYREHCLATAGALVRRLGLLAGSYTFTFQSRFGREPWLEPATEPTLVAMAKAGTKKVLVLSPGFTTDCLETLDELGYEAAHAFRAAGGEELWLVPCLNDHPRWIDAMAAIVRRESSGWLPGE